LAYQPDAAATIRQYGVELFCSGKIIQIRGLKRDPRGTALFHRALPCPFQSVCVAVEANDATSRANDVGSEERDIPNSGAQIQHAHARRNTSGAEELLCVRTEYAPLEHQAFVFARGLAKDAVDGALIAIGYHANLGGDTDSERLVGYAVKEFAGYF
jgi:hypothetical protein